MQKLYLVLKLVTKLIIDLLLNTIRQLYVHEGSLIHLLCTQAQSLAEIMNSRRIAWQFACYRHTAHILAKQYLCTIDS